MMFKKLKQFLQGDPPPTAASVNDLLTDKTHLIDGDNMPESFVTFLNHCNSWQINHLRWQKEQVEYSWHSDINWPNEFGREVVDTFERLKRRHAALIKVLGSSLPKGVAPDRQKTRAARSGRP